MSRKTRSQSKSISLKKQAFKSVSPKFILDTLGWLVRCEQKFVSGDQWRDLSQLTNTLEGILQTRGKDEVIRIAKAMRLFIFRIVADEFKCSVGLKQILVTTDLPNKYKDLLCQLNDDHTNLFFIRLVLTIFYSTRYITISPRIQLSTIEEAYKGTVDLSTESFERFIDRRARNFWRILLERRTWEPKPFNALYFKSYHLTTKAGPNGHALWRSIDDFRNLPESLKTSLEIIGGPKLQKHFKVLDSYSGLVNQFLGQAEGEILTERNAIIEKLKKKPNKFNKRKLKGLVRSLKSLKLTTKYVRKITALADQEGKTRTVAIFDYFSQTALRPLHNYLFSILRKIPQDCTFDQGSFYNKLKIEGFSASTDLSAFTDRFPFIFNESLIRTRFGRRYASAWKDVMINYPFSLRKVRDDIKYNVGNPMGAYSSWNSTALAHHFLIYLACQEIGLDFKSARYTLLGDDLVIQDESLNNKYLELLSSYGVSYSKEKSHINSNGVLEFAKRFIVRGEEITPFPVSALYVCRKKPLLALNTMLEEGRKGWFQTQQPLSVFSKWIECTTLSSSFRRKTLLNALPIVQINLAIQGFITMEEALRPILENKYPHLINHFNDDFEAKALKIFKQVVMQMFEKSFEDRGGKTLGQLALDLVIFITGLELKTEDINYQDIIESVPILGVYGLIEELYLKLYKEVDELKTLYEGDWKFTLKALALPSSDEIFYLPNKELLMHTSFKMTKILDSLLKSIPY